MFFTCPCCNWDDLIHDVICNTRVEIMYLFGNSTRSFLTCDKFIISKNEILKGRDTADGF